MNNEEIRIKIKNGELIRDGKKLYNKEEWAKIQNAEIQTEHFDLLQLTKKIQL